MPRIVLDAATLQQLHQVRGIAELVDPAGNVVGRFIPASARGPEPTISEAELDRRHRAGGGRPLADILADLEKRA